MTLWEAVNELSIMDIAKEVGLQITSEQPSYAMALCPFHGDHKGQGGEPNLALLKNKQRYKCHKCGESGSVVDFWAKFFSIEPVAALHQLAEKYHVKDPEEGKPHEHKPPKKGKKKGDVLGDSAKKQAEIEHPKLWDKDRIEKAHAWLLNPINKDHLDYFLNLRKVSKEYVIQKKIGLDMYFAIDFPESKDMVFTVPAFDTNGDLLAIRVHSRLFRKHKKFVKGSMSKIFYDLTTYKADADEIWIPEGEGDSWTIEYQLKKNTLTSLSGAAALAQVFQADMSILGDLAAKKRIVLCPDNDSAGLQAMARIRFYLPKEQPVYRIYWPPDFAKKQDVSHWVNTLGRTADELETYIKTFSWAEAQEILQKIADEKAAVEALQKEGVKVKEENGSYYRMKRVGEDIEWERISNFVIRGKATIEIDGQAYTRCDLLTPLSEPELNKQLPPDIWIGKRDFLKGFPHTKFEFTGGENDIQQIKRLVTKTIKKEDVKKGVDYIGTVGDLFVGPGFAISKDGPIDNPPVEYITQHLPLEKAILLINHPDVTPIVKEFFDVILKVNKPNVIIPTLGWIFACFFKERVRARLQYFPLLSVFGTSGAGKTTFIQTMIRICGIRKNTQLMNANASAFTAMRMLACTNCIPLPVDELKEDAGKEVIDFWKRHARSAYGGETETRGRQDLSVKAYTYQAPLLILGETSILREKATIERTISIEPKLSDHTQATRDAFSILKNLELEALFPKIVQWTLSQDSTQFNSLWEKSKESLKAMQLPGLPPRVWDNFVTVMFGVEVAQAFAAHYKVAWEAPQEDRRLAMTFLSGEILTVSKRTKLGFDDMLEALAIMSKRALIKNDVDYVCKGEWLYIHLDSCVSAFRKYAHDVRHDGDVLGKKEYHNQAREIMNMQVGRYVHDCSKMWRFGTNTYRTIQISLRRAEKAGLDIAGFGFSTVQAPEEWEQPTQPNTEDLDRGTAEDQLPPELAQEPGLPAEEPVAAHDDDDILGGIPEEA